MIYTSKRELAVSVEKVERLLTASKQDFLEKGFMKAFMRTITAKFGITETSLYRNYL